MSCNCLYEVCGPVSEKCEAHFHVHDNLTDMWNACVCAKGEVDKWHELDCLMVGAWMVESPNSTSVHMRCPCMLTKNFEMEMF